MSQNIESLRQASYSHCRSTSHSISESAEKSQRYIQKQFNARSSTPASYLEQVYQNSLRRSAPRQPVYNGGPSDPFANIKAMLNDLPGVAANGPSGTRIPPPRYTTEDRVPYHSRDSSSHPIEPRLKTEECAPSRWQQEHHHADSYSYSAPQYSGSNSSKGSRSSSQYRTEERMPRERERERERPRQSHVHTEFRDAQGHSYEYTHTYYSSSASSPPQPRTTHTERPRSPSPTSRRDRSPPPQPRRTYTARPRTPPHHSASSSSSSYHTRPRARSPPPCQGMKPRTDLYAVLGISRSATATEIKKAHRVMSLKWHPDRCGEGSKDQATAMMAEINQANDVLGDEKKRAYYDRTGMMGSDL